MAARRGMPAYAAVAAVAVCATLTWFHAGRFIAGGDVAPFIFDGYRHEYQWLWNHALSGAGSRSFQIAYSGLLWTNAVVRAVGGSDELSQRLVLVGLVAALGLGAAYLVGAFTDRRTVVAAGGVLGVFNAFVLVSVPNPLVLAALGLMGMVGGTLFRVADGRRCRAWLFAAGTVGASVLAFNPALLAVVVVWVGVVLGLVWAMWGSDGAARSGRFLLRAAPLVLLLNAWWLVPTAMTLFGPEGSLLAPQRDVVSWSWTHARSSLSNVTTMTSAWGLDHREYFPYAGRLQSPPWGLLRFGLPLAALAAPLLTSGRRRRLALALTAVALACIFVGKGLHPPLAGVNLWLYQRVPGFWLLREPATKVGLVQLLAFVALAALTLAAVLERRRQATGAARRALTAGPVLAVAAVAAFPYPLWTGDVIADARPLLPSAHVAVPDAWRDAAGFLNGSSLRGKVLVLPLDDFYQMPTTWGYYGADVIPQSLLAAPVLARTGDGYFGNVPGFQDQVNAVELALLDGDVAAVPRLFESLGVSHVLLRHDLDTSFPGRSFTDPVRLEAPLAQVPGLRAAKTFGPLTVFSMAGPWQGPVRTYGSLVQSVGPGDPPLATLVGAAAPGDAVVRDVENADGVAVQLDEDGSPVPFELVGAGPFVLSPRATGLPSYRVRRRDTAAGPALELSLVHDLVLDGVPLDVPPKVYPLPTADVPAVRVGDVVSTLTGDGAVVAIPPATPLVALAPRPAGTALGPFGPVGDCYREDTATALESGLRADPLPGQPGPAFRLEAARHSACISAEAAPVAPRAPYRLHLEYRSVSGAPARACVWQEPVQRCADLPGLAPASDWAPFDAVFTPDPAATGLSLYLYADAPGGPGPPATTRTEYRDVTLSALQPVLTSTVAAGELTVAAPPLAAGTHVLSRAETRPPADLGPFSALADCADSDPRTPAEAGLRARVADGPDGVVELRARAHSACVSAGVGDYQRGRPYRLRLEYRTVRGTTARICVWQEGAGRCAPTPALERSTGWRQLDLTVAPSEDAAGLSLFLYADGPGRGETVEEFRHASLRPTSTGPVVFVTRPPPAEPPPVSSRSDGPARYDIQLGPARGPFVLALPESYSSGWKLTGLPRGTIVDHLNLDGYANGWRVAGVLPDGPLHLVARYQPAFAARSALAVSRWAAVALALSLLGLRAVRRLPVGRQLGRWAGGDGGAGAPVRAVGPAPVLAALAQPERTPTRWSGPGRARLAVGLLLGAGGLAGAALVPASSGWALAAGVLALAVLGPPWRWLFGAGLALMAAGAAAVGFGLGAASDALVAVGLLALLVAVILAVAQDGPAWRRLTAPGSTPTPMPAAVPAVSPAPRRLDRPIPALAADPQPWAAFHLGTRTYVTRMDARLRRMAELVDDLDVRTILDVGCGGGVLLRDLARHGRYELYGVDVYPEDEESAGWYRSADVTRGLPYADARFDCVVLGEVIEHVPDPDALLREVRRILRPGGYLVVSTPNLVCWANRVLVPLGVQPLFTETSTEVNMGRYLEVLGQGRKVVGHLKVFTHRSLDELLDRAGYSVLRQEGTPFFFPFPLSVVDRALARFPSVASGLVYVARKDER